MTHQAATPTAVRVVLADPEGRLLLLQRAADDDLLPGLWEFPGGGIDPGETAVDAARRELREEVGMDLHTDALQEWGVFERDADGRMRYTAFFVADCAAEDCHPTISHEHDDWRWVAGTRELPVLTPSALWAVGRHRWPTE